MPGVDNAYTELALSLVGDWLTHVSERRHVSVFAEPTISGLYESGLVPPMYAFPGAIITGVVPGNGLSLGIRGDMFDWIPRYM